MGELDEGSGSTAVQDNNTDETYQIVYFIQSWSIVWSLSAYFKVHGYKSADFSGSTYSELL
jgi:hypothetical protein